MINMENRDYDMTMTPILSKYQYQKPKDFGDYTERCYPVSAVMDMLKQYSLEQNKQLLDEVEMLKFRLKAADSVNENLSKQVEWISVEDRLPTERVEFVLLFNADAPKYNQCVYQGVWFAQESKFKSDTNHNLLGTVTHWMPLPNQPK